MNYIKELYKGNLIPDDKCYSSSDDYEKINSEAIRYSNALEKLISENDAELFENYVIAQDKLTDLSNYENFERGFKIGMGLAFNVIHCCKQNDEIREE